MANRKKARVLRLYDHEAFGLFFGNYTHIPLCVLYTYSCIVFFFIMVEPSTPGLHTIQTVTLGVYIELSKVIASFSFSFARKRLP